MSNYYKQLIGTEEELVMFKEWTTKGIGVSDAIKVLNAYINFAPSFTPLKNYWMSPVS